MTTWAKLARVILDGFRIVENRRCPKCAALALCVLPAALLAQQPDGTNIVCHPLLGGCNHGFEAAFSKAVQS